jgi:hypothetical protein
MAQVSTWLRSPVVEDWLAKKAVPFDYVDALPLSEIDTVRSRGNQARFGNPIKRDLAETYGIQMLDGSAFPAVIVYAHARDRYTIISGNHRHEGAAQAKLETIAAYVVRTTDRATIEVLTHTANAIEGVRDSREDAVQHALYLKNRHGFTMKDAAAMCGVPERSVRTAHQLQVAQARMEKLKIEASEFHPSTRTRLGNIQSDTALQAAASLVKDASLGGELLDELVTSLNQERTEDAQIGVIQQWEARPDIQARKVKGERGKRRVPHSRDDDLATLVSKLIGHLERNTVGARVEDGHRPVLAERWKQVNAMMTAYLGVEEHERANGTPTELAGVSR